MAFASHFARMHHRPMAFASRASCISLLALFLSVASALSPPGIASSPMTSTSYATLRACVVNKPLHSASSCFIPHNAPIRPLSVPASHQTSIVLVPGCDPLEACIPSGGHVPRCALVGLARSLDRLGHLVQIAGVPGASGCARDVGEIVSALPGSGKGVLVGRGVGCGRAAEAARADPGRVRAVLCLAERKKGAADFGLVETELGLRVRRRRRPLPTVGGPWGDGEGREGREPDDACPQVETDGRVEVWCVADCRRWVTKSKSVDELPEADETMLVQVERLLGKLQPAS